MGLNMGIPAGGPDIPGGIMPGVPGMSEKTAAGQGAADTQKDDEIAGLKAQLAALNAKIDKLT